jgi:hypothetical protein
MNIFLTKIFLITLFYAAHSFAFTLNNNISAGFSDPNVAVYVTSNSACPNAQVSKEELSQMVSEAIHNYWNQVPTSTLRLSNGGILTTTNDDYLDGHLCSTQSGGSCTPPLVPTANGIVIACNDNQLNYQNNPNSSILAVTLPNSISGGSIVSSVIVINDMAQTPFRDLSYADKVATIAHEIGHAVGLGHTPDGAALMYAEVIPNRHSLGHDDMKGVSYLYPVKFDGCGLLSTTQDNHSNKNGTFLLLLCLSFLATLLASRKIKRKD